MKHILKYLTIAGVLILFLPFFRMCQRPAEKPVKVDSIAQKIDTTNISSDIQAGTDSVYLANDIEQEDTESPITKVLNSIKSIFDVDGATSGFQLSIILPQIIINSVKEHNKIDEIDKTFFSLIFFFLILINSFLLILFSFLKKINIIWSLAYSNILLLIISYILLEVNIEEIKFGSYLFVVNSLLIIYFATKYKKLKQTIIPPSGG